MIDRPYLTVVISAGPTDNRRHTIARYGQRRLIDTDEYRTWKFSAHNEIIKQLPHGWKPLSPTEKQQLPYLVQVFLPSRRVDAANYDKGVRDILKISGVWKDDRWTMPQFLPARLDPTNPRIVVLLPMNEATRLSFWPLGKEMEIKTGKTP